MRAVRSFDPCLPCGVHMYTGGGKRGRAAPHPADAGEALLSVRRHARARRSRQSVVDLVARAHDGSPRDRGPVRVGALSGVVPDAMQFCFEWPRPAPGSRARPSSSRRCRAGSPAAPAERSRPATTTSCSAGAAAPTSSVVAGDDLRRHVGRAAEGAGMCVTCGCGQPAGGARALAHTTPSEHQHRPARDRGARARAQRPPRRAQPRLAGRRGIRRSQPDELAGIGQDLAAGAHHRRDRGPPRGLRDRGRPGDRGRRRADRRAPVPAPSRSTPAPAATSTPRWSQRALGTLDPDDGLAAVRRERRQPGLPGAVRRRRARAWSWSSR